MTISDDSATDRHEPTRLGADLLTERVTLLSGIVSAGPKPRGFRAVLPRPEVEVSASGRCGKGVDSRLSRTVRCVGINVACTAEQAEALLRQAAIEDEWTIVEIAQRIIRQHTRLGE